MLDDAPARHPAIEAAQDCRNGWLLPSIVRVLIEAGGGPVATMAITEAITDGRDGGPNAPSITDAIARGADDLRARGWDIHRPRGPRGGYAIRRTR